MSDFSEFMNELNQLIQTSPSNQVIQPNVSDKKENDKKVSFEINTVHASSSVVSSNEQQTKKIKLLIVSTHIYQINGYSKVIYNLIKQLSVLPWIEIVHFATQKIISVNGELGRKYPENVKVIDASALEKDKQGGFALSELANTIQNEKPNIVFMYNDLSVICAYIENIRKVIENRTFKIWTYVDLTYLAPPQTMIDVLNRDVERIFCFTKEWKNVIKSHGITRPVDVMNHGIDFKMFRSVPRDMARQSLGLPKDVFLFTSLNKNIPRKRLDLLVMSFVKLIIRFPIKPLFLLVVADKGEHGGYQLFDIFARELKLNNASTDMFGNRLLITSKDACYRDEDINLLYNSGDVGVSCAEGEGFGLCTFEQMALGVPQIVPTILGYNEYCTNDNSIMIKPKMRYYLPQSHHSVIGEAQMVDPEDVSKAMERYVFDEDLRKLHGQRGKDKISTYTWENCVSILIKRLEALRDDDD
jgi:glycosyltransferase involved in cell wall biosynthesis